MSRNMHVRNSGFSLIELLVSMVIGLVVTLAITSVLIRSEGSKRTSTSVNDINQTGAYTAFVLDRAIRSAGSGFSQRWSDVYGCLLDVSQASTHLLPFPSAIPATSTFKNVASGSFPIRLIPVIIGKSLADNGGNIRGDVLMVMGGTGGIGESPRVVQTSSVTGTSTSGSLRLPNTLGYRTGDLVLLSDTSVSTSCMLQQVAFTTTPTGAIYAPGSPGPTGSSDQTLPLSGTYYGSTGTNVSLASFGPNTLALQMGNEANLPQFQFYGVGANNTLFACDLLATTNCASATPSELAVADGVVEMRALYGLDTDTPPNGILDTWVDPIAGSGYEASVLTNGSAASRTKLRQIVAVRLGLILRTSLAERAPAGGNNPEGYLQASGTTVKLFSDLGTTLTQTRTLTPAELNYRFRTVELTIPLRNVLLAP